MTCPTSSPYSLAGETALVTGGGTGLGSGIARALFQAGARVALVGRRPEVLQSAAASIDSEVRTFPADITELAALPALVAKVEDALGPLTILVNNAGIHLKKPAVETSDADFDAVLRTHVAGAFALTREVGKRMVARRRGSVLFTASMASFMGIPNIVAYTAAKTAYLGLVRALATEWGPHGVRVNAIAPGWIASPMLESALSNDPARRAKILGRIPSQKFGEPEDIGWAATYLSSPAARYVNGVILPVDGGAAESF